MFRLSALSTPQNDIECLLRTVYSVLPSFLYVQQDTGSIRPLLSLIDLWTFVGLQVVSGFVNSENELFEAL